MSETLSCEIAKKISAGIRSGYTLGDEKTRPVLEKFAKGIRSGDLLVYVARNPRSSIFFKLLYDWPKICDLTPSIAVSTKLCMLTDERVASSILPAASLYTEIFENDSTQTFRDLAKTGIALQKDWCGKVGLYGDPKHSSESRAIGDLIGHEALHLGCTQEDLKLTVSYLKKGTFDEKVCDRLVNDSGFFRYFREVSRSDIFKLGLNFDVLKTYSFGWRRVWMSMMLAEKTKDYKIFSFFDPYYRFREGGVPDEWPINMRNFPYN